MLSISFMHFNLMKWSISNLDDDHFVVLVSHILCEKVFALFAFFIFIYSRTEKNPNQLKIKIFVYTKKKYAYTPTQFV